MNIETDFLVIGSGIAGLSFALKAAEYGRVTIVTKGELGECNTDYAQGGIASVMYEPDTFEKHIRDTMVCGAGICDPAAVEQVVTRAPSVIKQLIQWGTKFDKDASGRYDLNREGGHSEHRILHHDDLTGHEIERALMKRVKRHHNIDIYEHHFAVDILTQHHLGRLVKKSTPDITCFGAYVLNLKKHEIYTVLAKVTVMATGGVGNIYHTTTNPSVATGDGVAMVSDTTISTTQDTSGGIHVAGGGTLYARDLTVTTKGESSAAIRSDRGSGTMVVDGGTYVAQGVGSPAVYVTADVTIHEASLAATGSEALCLEGLNSVRLYDCDLTGNMADLDQNDNTWTVILYQSMSGDSEVGEGRFEMEGGSLVSGNGGIFYTTNTESEFVLSNVEISADNSEYFLRCTGNANQRGWGQSGANGAECAFTAINQKMDGDVIWDSISNLDLYVTQGSVLTGAVVDDESCAGNGGSGTANVTIDADSKWVVTGDSTLTNLACEGEIVDAAGNAVSVVGTDGAVYVQGDSEYTVTVGNYAETCDLTGAGEITGWDASVMPM